MAMGMKEVLQEAVEQDREVMETLWGGGKGPDPVLSKELDDQLAHQIRILHELRNGKAVQRRSRAKTSGVECIWREFQLKLTDPVYLARLDFDSLEYRVMPKEVELHAWAVVTPQGAMMGLFTNELSARSYADSLCMLTYIVPMRAEFEAK